MIKLPMYSTFEAEVNHEAELVLVGMAAECCVFLLLLMRRGWKAVPIFTLYTLWTIVSDASFVFTRVYSSGLKNYLVEMALDSTLQLLVLAELVRLIVQPVRTSLPKKYALVVPLLLIILGAICWPLAGFSVPHGLSSQGYLLVTLQQTVALLRVLIFLTMVAFSQFFSIGWRDRVLQIASGLGFYSILSLIVSVLHTHQAVGPQYHWLDLVTSFGYLGTLAYWVVSFAQKEPEARKISPQMVRFLVSIGGTVQAERLALETAVKKKPGNQNHF